MNRLLEIVPQPLLQELIVQGGICFRLLAAGLLFFRPLRKKPRFGLRMAACLLACLAGWALIAYVRYRSDSVWVRFFTHLLIFNMPLLIVAVTRGGGIVTRLKALCASFAAEEMAGDAFFLLVWLTGGNEHETISLFHFGGAYRTTVWDWLIYLGLNFLFCYALYRLFRYNRSEELDAESRGATAFLTVFCLLMLSIPDCLRSAFSDSAQFVTLFYRFYLISVSVFVLFYCGEITLRSRYRTEKAIIDRVLVEERKQYAQLKDNIDLINMRCHDLRHQLDDFSGRLTEREIAELRDAMDFYDSNIKTGNEVLDVVLRLHAATCKKEHIQLSCLADGACLSFMHTRHLYALFNNALGNAIEAVLKLPDEEKRVVSMSVHRADGAAEIEVTNYFDGKVVAEGDTAKEDRAHHGFGTMSMRYIVREYGGTLTIQTQKDVFLLTIRIPIPNV